MPTDVPEIHAGSLHVCHAFGLRIASDLAIPGASPQTEEDRRGALDLTIETGVVTPLPDARQLGPYLLDAKSLVFDRSGVARFGCDRTGARIVVQGSPSSKKADVAAYLIATAPPATLWLRGELVCHAAAAVLPGMQGAIGFLGESGAGKSTLAHTLVSHGASLVAEDSLCVRQAAGLTYVSGLPGCVFLRRPEAEADGERTAHFVPARQTLEKAKIAAWVVLGKLESQAPPDLVRLTPLAALQTLMRHRHRAAVPHLLGHDAALLSRWSSLAQQVPMYNWTAPGNLFAAHWTQLAQLTL